jgi:hypothetical protein
MTIYYHCIRKNILLYHRLSGLGVFLWICELRKFSQAGGIERLLVYGRYMRLCVIFGNLKIIFGIISPVITDEWVYEPDRGPGVPWVNFFSLQGP